MKISDVYLIYTSFAGEQSNEAYTDFAEVLDTVEQIFVGEFYDGCKGDIEFENLYRETIEKIKCEMKEAKNAGRAGFYFEVENTCTTVTFKQLDQKR